MAARGNDLGQHRIDIQFAARDFLKFMSQSEEQGWRAAKSLVRSWNDHGRLVVEYKFQKLPDKSVVRLEAGFAGCKCARRTHQEGL